ncbi:MAG: hypothetical protein M3254_09865 [Actinomycetota bacterium]|nr:hypothetical protein [Actinomycetota bacterium]
MTEGLSMKMRVLMGLLLRRRTCVAGTTRGAGAFAFELMLAPSREDPERYAIESVRKIDCRTAHRTLRTIGLAGSPSLVSWGSILEERDEGGAGEAGSEPRITFVRLAPRQALRMFGEIRRRYSDVRELYAHLKAKKLELIGAGARGAVMRAYAADGTVRGKGIVIELPHRRSDGAEASFHVSIKDWMAGEGGSGEVRVDYDIRRIGRVETYEIRDGRVCLLEE